MSLPSHEVLYDSYSCSLDVFLNWEGVTGARRAPSIYYGLVFLQRLGKTGMELLSEAIVFAGKVVPRLYVAATILEASPALLPSLLESNLSCTAENGVYAKMRRQRHGSGHILFSWSYARTVLPA